MYIPNSNLKETSQLRYANLSEIAVLLPVSKNTVRAAFLLKTLEKKYAADWNLAQDFIRTYTTL